MNRSAAMSAVALLATLSGTKAGELELDDDALNVSRHYSQGGWQVGIQSRIDLIVIATVKVNRGNCEFVMESPRLPREIRFGQTVLGYCACNPIEISVKTNFGTGVYEWDH